MSLCAKSLCGRKKQSGVWDYFEYIASKCATRCNVENDKAEQCGVLLAGKNPTNLKRHLEACHSDTFTKVEAAEALLVATVAGKRQAAGDDTASKRPSSGLQT